MRETKLIRQIKGYRSYKTRKHPWYPIRAKSYGKKFQNEGHFYRSARAVSTETMKKYIEDQGITLENY
ncbi:hypothetical protein CMI42_00975 [Candidatus Pacearchaeota archaeon]|nr:hypothetical protein [Candidatus Pacearchaeota archaeon]